MEYDIEFLKNIDDTLSAIIKDFAEGKTEHRLDISDLQLRIRLQGPYWAGIVDKSIAKFVIDLDQRLTSELKKRGMPIPKTGHGFVALQVDDGSLAACLRYSQAILQTFLTLKPAHQLILVVSVLTAVGIYKVDSVIAELNKVALAKEETARESIRSQERVELVQSVARIAENTQPIQAPMRSLISTMSEEDTIELPGAPEPLKRESARARLEKSKRSDAKQIYIDQRYKVVDLLTNDPENWSVGLKYGDISFRAKLELSSDEVDQLMKDFQTAHAQRSEIAPDLRVTARVSARGVTHARVVGVGEPRYDAVRLSEALEKAKGPKITSRK